MDKRGLTADSGLTQVDKPRPGETLLMGAAWGAAAALADAPKIALR
jgi:NADPH-dependent curcumin reductase CurA